MRRISPEQAQMEQRVQGVTSIMIMILTVFLIQLWLLTIALEEYMGGKTALAAPTFLASCGCFALNLRLLVYVNKYDRNEGQK